MHTRPGSFTESQCRYTMFPMTHPHLSKERFEQALAFLDERARPLERARARFHFRRETEEAVVEALSAYQNDDGGFGRALEPDLRTPASSALCTSVAFQVMRTVRAPRVASPVASPMIRRALAWLVANLDLATGWWRIIPPQAESSPHAPWWSQQGDHRFDTASLNPTAELLGVLVDYAADVPPETIKAVAARVEALLEATGNMEMHDLLCCMRLARTVSLPAATRNLLEARLESSIAAGVARDQGQWSGYALRPLQVVDAPDSPHAAGLAEAVDANLDFEIGEQRPDGSWPVPWSWGDSYPEAWPEAEADWRGVVTLERLFVLDAFGRIA